MATTLEISAEDGARCRRRPRSGPGRGRLGARAVLRPALVVALGALGCGASRWPAPADRIVAVGAEDEAEEAVSCRVVARAELGAPAEVARPALSGGERSLAVAWIGSEDGRRVLRAEELDRRLAVAAPGLRLEAPDGLPFWPALARCGRTGWLAWQESGGRGDSVRAAELRAGAAGPVLELEPGGASPALACAGELGAVAYAVRRRGGVRDVALRWLSPSPSEPVVVSGATDAAASPALSCDRRRCVLAWSDLREGVAEIYGAAIDAGAREASPPVRLSASNRRVSGAGGAYRPALALLGPRSLLAAWHDGRSRGGPEVYALGWAGRGRAGTDHRVSASPGPATAPALAGCGRSAVVAFRDRRGGPPAVLASALSASGRRLSGVVVLSGEAVEASEPVAACLGASPVVAWTEQAEGGGVVRLASLECR